MNSRSSSRSSSRDYYGNNERDDKVETDGLQEENNQEFSSKSNSTKKIVRRVEYEEEKNFFMRFQKNHPILTVLIAAIILIIIILSIVLPLTLVKKKEEKYISPKCPDGSNHPRIDCLPDRKMLTDAGANLESTCKKRMCCWSAGVELGGPNCAFPTNYGFRNFKTKDNSFASKWYELVRLNSPNSYAKSDISNLETRIEMHTDNRLRIRVNLAFIEKKLCFFILN